MSKKKLVKAEVPVKVKKWDEDAWQEPLESTQINDDYWWCNVTMMVELRTEHGQLVSIYNEAAEEGKRKAIYTLSYQKMLMNVRSLARQDPDKCTALQLICHYANKSFESNGESTWLVARIIKYMIYRAKADVVTRIWKEQELKRAIDEEYTIMQTVLDPSSSKNAQKKAETTLLGKANTRLRIREEEWRDITYVDDAPHDGPNLYIVLTGFHDPDLPVELLKIGVPLTCLLKIRRPHEEIEYVPFDKDEDTSIDNKKRSRFVETYTVDKGDLCKFWMTLKNYLNDRQTVEAFNGVAFLTFKPPPIPDDRSFPADDFEYEQLKKDLYDRVSFIVYDLYEILRNHSNYLRSMLIQGYDADEIEEPEVNVYRAVLDALPEECVTVPTLLHALLLQLEANIDDGTTTDRSSHHEEKVLSPKEEEVVEEEGGHAQKVEPFKKVESIGGEIDEISWVHERLRELGRKYNLHKEETFIPEKPDDSPIELILHGDHLRLDTHHLEIDSDVAKILDPRGKGLTLADVVLHVLRDPRVVYSWDDHEPLTDEKLKEYMCHVGNIIKYFEPGVSVNRENIVHYLHLSVFDKMIQGRPSRKTEDKIEVSSDTLSICSQRRMFSVPYTKKDAIVLSRLTKSDTQIDYGRPVEAFERCPTLFELVDPKEMILPSYSENRIKEQMEIPRTSREMIVEFGDVEFLPLRVLLQVFHECCQYFECFESRYFEPTDAILLYFSNDYAIGDVTERLLVSSIRTPVCLRDFVRYVLKEEIDWLDRMEERYRLESIDRESKTIIKGITPLEELRLRFTDEDFILPNSLKARDMEKAMEGTEKKVDYIVPDNSKEKEEKGKQPGKEKKAKTGLNEKVSSKGKKREENGIDSSFLPPRQILSLDCAKPGEPHEFVGYDLGKLRVQVTEKRRIFQSVDGTVVRAILERWLYENSDLRIDVNLHGCVLHLSEKLNDPDAESNVFHLTTEEGIVLAFSKRTGSTGDSSLKESDRQELDFDFHASWPSGLAISLVNGDGPKNPFYVRQSYISKRPKDVVEEVYRKFLRNGTVLKFFLDNRVVVLRPNACIVECTAFEDGTPRDKNLEEEVKASKEKEVGRSGGKRKKDTPVSSKQRTSVRLVKENGNEDKQGATPPSTGEGPMSQPDVSTGMRYAPTRIKVTGYNVLDHDGRQYEVLRDLVVHEYDRLLVRESSDCEMGEIFTRRADGTDMLFRSNGELIVNFTAEFVFTDGTRITTGYIVEEKPLTCDWTREEFRRYFGLIKLDDYKGRSFLRTNNNDYEGNNDDDNDEDDDDRNGKKNRNGDYQDDRVDEEDNELWRDESSNEEDRYQDEMTRISIAESFVSVLLTCRFEHKNYATVSYDQSAVNCTLSMPADLRVSISRRGHFEVSALGKVNLKIKPERLIFTGEMCTTCAGGSTTVYNFGQRSGAILSTILTSTDLFGNVFTVKSDGTTTYRRSKTSRRSSRKIDFYENMEDLEGWMEMSAEEEDDEEEERGETEVEDERRRKCSYESKTDHGKYCEEYGGLSWQRSEVMKKFRIFSVNRDLTAYEYHHRSVRNEEETKAVFNEEANVIHYPVSSNRSSLRRLITFVPLETGLRSKALLQSYRIPKVEPTDGNKRDVLRSTYSIPYDWVFPFGRHGRGICTDMYNMSLTETIEERLRPPKTLRLRILHGFKEPDRNAIIDLQRALACYCKYVLEDTDECGRFPECGISASSLLNDDHESSKDNIRELALGIRRTIDVDSYHAILRQQAREETVGKSRRKVEQTPRRLSMKSKSKKSNEEQLEWYKSCMRERIILPYFENVIGSCFLLVKYCLDRAFLTLVEKDDDDDDDDEEEEEEEEEVKK